MEENFNTTDQLSETPRNIFTNDGENLDNEVTLNPVRNNIQKVYNQSNSANKDKKQNIINRVNGLMTEKSILRESITKPADTDSRCKNSIIFSNTLPTFIIAIFVFIYSYKSKNNYFYKSKDLWLIFLIFLISCFASLTNFPVEIVNNYKVSIYINQFIMFLLGTVLIYRLCRNQNYD